MTGHIFIQDEIGVHTKPEMVRAQISPEFSDYEIHINSNGGDVYDGYQIGSLILNLGKPSLAIVEGMCASIATYIACCADKVAMIPQGSWTIHDPTAQTGGRAEDLIQAAAQLKTIKDDIINRYMSKVGRNGITAQQLSDAMAKETTYDPIGAKAWGFVDDVRERLRAVAKIDLTKFKMETLTKQETIGLFEKLGQKLDSFVTVFKAEKPKEQPKKVEKTKVKAAIKKTTKIVNVLELTLTDGTVWQCDAEDPNNLQGATVTNQDGTPIVEGTYETADGLELEVTPNSDGSATVTEAEQQATNESEDDPAEDDDLQLHDESKKNDPKNEEDDEPTDDMETYDELMGQLETIQKKLKKATPGAQPVTEAPAAKAKTDTKFKAKVDVKDKKEDEFQAKITALETQLAELKKQTVGKPGAPKAAPLEEDEDEHNEEFTSFANTVTNYLTGRGLIQTKDSRFN